MNKTPTEIRALLAEAKRARDALAAKCNCDGMNPTPCATCAWRDGADVEVVEALLKNPAIIDVWEEQQELRREVNNLRGQVAVLTAERNALEKYRKALAHLEQRARDVLQINVDMRDFVESVAIENAWICKDTEDCYTCAVRARTVNECAEVCEEYANMIKLAKLVVVEGYAPGHHEGMYDAAKECADLIRKSLRADIGEVAEKP